MITTFELKGFKSIESAELDLGIVNVFIGANGGGKSNLLEALAVIAAAASGKVDQEALVRRGCRPKGFFKPMFRDLPDRAETFLKVTNDSHKYFVDLLSPPLGRLLGWEFQQEVLKADERELVNRREFAVAGKGDPQAGLAALKLAEGEFSDLAADFLKTLAGYSIYSADTLIMRGLVPDWQVREPVGLSGGRLMEALDEMTRHAQDNPLLHKLNDEFASSFEFVDRFNVFEQFGPEGEKIEGSQILGFRDKYFRSHPDGAPYILGANQVNEGALYFLFAAVLCLHPNAPRLFAIDNADHGLNPLLAKRMMTTMCKWLLEPRCRRQVLMTTHNPLVLDGLPLEDNRVRLFTVDRDNRGRTIVKRFLIKEEHRAKAAGGWTLSRMWVNGLIGGVPNV